MQAPKTPALKHVLESRRRSGRFQTKDPPRGIYSVRASRRSCRDRGVGLRLGREEVTNERLRSSEGRVGVLEALLMLAERQKEA